MDFSENYSIRSWFRSLEMSRRTLLVFLFWPVFGGVLMLGFDWVSTVGE